MQSAQLMDGLLSCEQVSPRIHNLGLFSDLQQQQLNCLYMYRLCFIGSNTGLGRNLQSLKVHKSHAHYIIPYSGNFSGRKLSRISSFFLAICKSFLCKIWGCGILGSTSEHFAKVFSVKILFSTNLWKFSPTNVSPYTAVEHALAHACFQKETTIHKQV